MKNTVKVMLIIVSLSLLFFMLQFIQEDDKNKESLEHSIDNIIGEKIFIPDNLRILFPFSSNYSDSIELASSELKIYTYVNTDCSKCILEIEDWVEFFHVFSNINISLIIICGSNYNDYNTMLYLLESGEIKIEQNYLFADDCNLFLENNSFMKKNKHFETVLTDQKNNIILTGNPIYSKKIKDMYIKGIVNE